ncbi:hypothetical protein QFC24_002244 [Naganishia onofrii]|uniref:Uncharacterized protein n=1 Tax=Naganishia onofrii TaxID=1851511 RepID=A0ACC2XS96_9TREE|nr:hypothetical protein QFC24_002244 [Naganishia onofrii]
MATEHLKQQLDNWTEGYVTRLASVESRLSPGEHSEAETCSSRSSTHSSKPDWHRFETAESAQEFLQPAANYAPPPAGLPERPATQDHQTSSKATQQHHATRHPTTMKRGDNSVKQKLLYTAWKKVSKFDKKSNDASVQHRPLHKSLSTRGSARAYLHGIIKQKTPVKTPSHYLLRSNSNKLLVTSSEHSAQNGNGESSSSLLINNGQIDLEPLKREKFRAQGFLITDDGALVVYTDGSAKGDGVAGGRPTRAGCRVWWGESGKAHDCHGNGVRFEHVRAHQGEFGNERADRLAAQGTELPAEPDRQWLGMDDLRKPLPRQQAALRLTCSGPVIPALPETHPLPETDGDEVLEVDEMLDADIDFHPNDRLALNPEEALEREGFILLTDSSSSSASHISKRPNQNSTALDKTNQAPADSERRRSNFVAEDSPEFELIALVETQANNKQSSRTSNGKIISSKRILPGSKATPSEIGGSDDEWVDMDIDSVSGHCKLSRAAITTSNLDMRYHAAFICRRKSSLQQRKAPLESSADTTGPYLRQSLPHNTYRCDMIVPPSGRVAYMMFNLGHLFSL